MDFEKLKTYSEPLQKEICKIFHKIRPIFPKNYTSKNSHLRKTIHKDFKAKNKRVIQKIRQQKLNLKEIKLIQKNVRQIYQNFGKKENTSLSINKPKKFKNFFCTNFLNYRVTVHTVTNRGGPPAPTKKTKSKKSKRKTIFLEPPSESSLQPEVTQSEEELKIQNKILSESMIELPKKNKCLPVRSSESTLATTDFKSRKNLKLIDEVEEKKIPTKRSSSQLIRNAFHSSNRAELTTITLSPNKFVFNKLELLKKEVAEAIRGQKTFIVDLPNIYRGIKIALVKRGWVEKITNPTTRKEFFELHNKSLSQLLSLAIKCKDDNIRTQAEALLKSRLIRANYVDFYWCVGRPKRFEQVPSSKNQMTNRLSFIDHSFVSKRGLAAAAKELRWLSTPLGEYELNHPRTYCLSQDGDVEEFVQDYKLTAAVSVILWVSETKEEKMLSYNGTIPLKMFDFALESCNTYLKLAKGLNLRTRNLLPLEWDEFMDFHFKIVHERLHFKYTGDTLKAKRLLMKTKAIAMIKKLKKLCPNVDIDGIFNLWILKPLGGSCGYQIEICQTMKQILEIVQKNSNNIYIVQKYIEKPLLIHDTKFHIRQWFLVGSTYPLTIWLYEEFYLRFSSQRFNLRQLDDIIHLTNNCVQTKYRFRTDNRESDIPVFNLWHSSKFKEYLTKKGFPSLFEQIKTGITNNIIASVVRLRHTIHNKKNTFQLFGADILVSNNFIPWLIEINGMPGMPVTTPIVDQMCNRVQKDLVKVVVDYSQNPKADTGLFRQIYLEDVRLEQPHFIKFPVLEAQAKKLMMNSRSSSTRTNNSRSGSPKTPERFKMVPRGIRF